MLRQPGGGLGVRAKALADAHGFIVRIWCDSVGAEPRTRSTPRMNPGACARSSVTGPGDGPSRRQEVASSPVTTSSQAPDRNLAMELVRVTEAAAMAASRWMGRGDKEGADGAAVNAMRIVLSSIAMDGVVIIGEGEKDNAPMLFNGERIGDGSPPKTDIAVDPIDGTTPTALGRGGALAGIAASERGTMFDPGPCVYMEKLAVGPRAKGACDIRPP